MLIDTYDEATLTYKYVYYQVALTDKNGNTQLSDIKMFTNNLKRFKTYYKHQP